MGPATGVDVEDSRPRFEYMERAMSRSTERHMVLAREMLLRSGCDGMSSLRGHYITLCT